MKRDRLERAFNRTCEVGLFGLGMIIVGLLLLSEAFVTVGALIFLLAGPFVLALGSALAADHVMRWIRGEKNIRRPL